MYGFMICILKMGTIVNQDKNTKRFKLRGRIKMIFFWGQDDSDFHVLYENAHYINMFMNYNLQITRKI